MMRKKMKITNGKIIWVRMRELQHDYDGATVEVPDDEKSVKFSEPDKYDLQFYDRFVMFPIEE